METIVSNKRVISDKSADAQRIINQKSGKIPPKTQNPPPSAKTEPAALPKRVTDLMESLSPEEKKLLIKAIKPAKAKTMSRMDAVCLALKDRKPETVQDWVKASNEVYGQENNQEALFNIRYCMKVLKNFNIAFPEK